MAVEFENELSLKDYVSIIKRRWLPMSALFLLAWIIFSLIGIRIPPIYRASGLIAIESPTISKALIGGNANELIATKYVDEHVDKIKQKVLSRENLRNINEKYNLFPGITKPSQLAETLGNSIEFVTQTKSTDGTAWAEKVTVGFSVAFEYSDPEKTYNVINDVIQQVLDQNAKDRTKRAEETTLFLTDELNRLKEELEVVEDKVADFKQEHSNSLPEHQQLHMNTLEQLRDSLQGMDIEYKSVQEELRYLDVELTTANANLNKSDRPNLDAAGRLTDISKLDQALEELAESQALYKDTHPTVKALKRKVALLQEEQKRPVKKIPKRRNPAAELAIAKIKSQIEAAKVKLSSINQEKANLRAQIAKVNRQVIQIPQVERGLIKLMRDYDNAKAKYEEMKSKQVNAKIAEDLEKNNKAERFTLIESPEFPQYRINISKTKVVGLGFIVSLGLGLGLGVLLEAMDKRVRGQAMLTSIINTKPLGIIPYIETHAEIRRKEKWMKFLIYLAIFIILLIVVLALIHFFVTPIGQYLVDIKKSLGSI